MGGFSIETIAYDISCSKATFDVVKTDERFLGLLTLARVVNALRFCQKAGLDGKDAPGPVGARSTLNSFLFAASVLYEGFIVVGRLGKNFKDLDSFKDGFGALLRDRKVKSLRKSVLNRMRKKFVFHFDEEVAKESLKKFELPEYRFASGIGKSSGEMVFVLADEVVMNYLLQPIQNESNESQKNRYQQIVKNTADTMREFVVAAESVMVDVLKEMGFKVNVLN